MVYKACKYAIKTSKKHLMIPSRRFFRAKIFITFYNGDWSAFHAISTKEIWWIWLTSEWLFNNNKSTIDWFNIRGGFCATRVTADQSWCLQTVTSRLFVSEKHQKMKKTWMLQFLFVEKISFFVTFFKNFSFVSEKHQKASC